MLAARSSAMGNIFSGGRPAPGGRTPSQDDQKLKAVPSLSELSLLKYTSRDGREQRVNIISRASPKWKLVAERISKHDEIIAQASQKYRDDPVDCLRHVFGECFLRNQPKDYSRNWYGIIEILEDIEESMLAAEVKEAVLSRR